MQSFAGGAQILNVTDKDIKNATEAKDLKRQTGNFIGNAPAPIADDQQVKDSDIQDFLTNYYKYLRTEGLSSASPPVIPSNNSPANSNTPIKQNTSSIQTEAGTPLALKAKEQQLLISKTPAAAKDQSSNAP